MIDFDKFHSDLYGQIDSVVAEYFPDNQERSGHVFAGDISGRVSKHGQGQGSFRLNLSNGLWTDAEDGSGGTLLDLVMEREGLDLKGAVELCKEKFGVVAVRIDGRDMSFSKGGSYTPKKPKRRRSGEIEVEGDKFTHAFFSGKVGPKEEAKIPVVRPDWAKELPKSLSYESLSNRSIFEDTSRLFRVEAVQGWKEGHGNVPCYFFPYFDKSGELVNYKIRSFDKDIGITAQMPKAPAICFGWNLVDFSQDYIVITEGEFDCMALVQCGINAISVNQGAGNVQCIKNDYDLIQKFPKIVIWQDSDTPGVNSAKKIVEVLGKDKCLYVHSDEYKDANEALEYVGVDGVVKILESAETVWKPGKLVSTLDYVNDIYVEMNGDENRDCAVLQFGDVKEPIHFVQGQVTIVSGYTNHGKTTWLTQQVVHLLTQGYPVCIFSGEATVEETLANLFRQITGLKSLTLPAIQTLCEALNGKVFIFKELSTAAEEELLECFRYCRQRFDVRYFICDSLMRVKPKKSTSEKEQHRRLVAVTEALVDFANDTRSHIFIVAHPVKPQQGKDKMGVYDIAGGMEVASLAHQIFTYWSDPELAKDGSPSGILKIAKTRVDKKYRGFEYDLYFDPDSCQIYKNALADVDDCLAKLGVVYE